MNPPLFNDPIVAIIVIALTWAIYLVGPKVKRYVDAKKLDYTWKTNQFANKQ